MENKRGRPKSQSKDKSKEESKGQKSKPISKKRAAKVPEKNGNGKN